MARGRNSLQRRWWHGQNAWVLRFAQDDSGNFLDLIRDSIGSALSGKHN